MKSSFVLSLSALLTSVPVSQATDGDSWEFFAFDNGVGRGTWTSEEQASLLKELGYRGIGYTGHGDVASRLDAFERKGLKVYSLYLACYVDREPAFDPGLLDAMNALEGRDVILWLTVQGKIEQGDSKAVEVVGQIGGHAAAHGLRVALYPHYGFHVATTEDALRVAEKLHMENVGVSFNLCHCLRAGNETRMEEILRKAAPRLFLVSINGADHQGGWDKLIQPLDRGEVDLAKVLSLLDQIDYRGPVGLQCYNIPGEPRDNLSRSIEAWRRLMGGRFLMESSVQRSTH